MHTNSKLIAKIHAWGEHAIFRNVKIPQSRASQPKTSMEITEMQNLFRLVYDPI